MPLNPNFAAQRLCHYWTGGAYYEGLALAFAGRMHWPNRRVIPAK